MPKRQATTASNREAVWRLLSSLRWCSTVDLVEAGGTEGPRRLRELREQCRLGLRSGFKDIECRHKERSNQYEYRLVRGRLWKSKKPTREEVRRLELRVIRAAGGWYDQDKDYEWPGPEEDLVKAIDAYREAVG